MFNELFLFLNGCFLVSFYGKLRIGSRRVLMLWRLLSLEVSRGFISFAVLSNRVLGLELILVLLVVRLFPKL